MKVFLLGEIDYDHHCIKGIYGSLAAAEAAMEKLKEVSATNLRLTLEWEKIEGCALSTEEYWRQSIKYRVEFRHYGPDDRVTVKGLFFDKKDAESYMSSIERDYEEGGCLWLVEVYPNGTEHDVYGFT